MSLINACNNSHTNGGEDGPLRVETHTTDREIIRTVLEAILTERGNSILASTIRDLGEQDSTGLNFPLEDISLLKEDPYFFLQAVKGMENAKNFLAMFIARIKLFPAGPWSNTNSPCHRTAPWPAQKNRRSTCRRTSLHERNRRRLRPGHYPPVASPSSGLRRPR